MIRIYVSILLFLLFSLQFQISAKPYQPAVKGGFKSCTVTEYRYNDSKDMAKSGQISYSLSLDEKGNPIEMIYYDNNKISSLHKIINNYNSKGLPVESIFCDAMGKAAERHCFVYDDATNMVLDTLFNSKGEATTIGHHIYDKNNFMTEEIYEVKIDTNEFSKGVTYFKNDKHGNKIEESANRSMSVTAEVSGEINLETGKSKKDAKVVESTDKNLDKVTYEYKYDDKGNILRSVRTSFDNYKFVKEYKYDEFGNIKEELSPDEKGKIIMKMVYEYKK